MQAAQDASLKTVDETTKLTEDAMALDFEEAAAYSQNAKDAEALRAARQKDLMNFASGLYDIDERTTVGAMSAAADAWGSQHYGEMGAQLNLEGTKYTADTNKATEQLVAEIQSNDNLRSALASLISNGALVPDDKIAQIFGVEPGSLRNPPQNNSHYSGGGYGGGGYSGGGYSGGGYSGQSTINDNIAQTQEANRLFNKYLMAEARGAAIGALGSVAGYDAAVATYDAAKAEIYKKANEKGMTLSKFTTWIKQKYGGTAADAKKFFTNYNAIVKNYVPQQ